MCRGKADERADGGVGEDTGGRMSYGLELWQSRINVRRPQSTRQGSQLNERFRTLQ